MCGGVAHLVEPVAPLGELIGVRQSDPVRIGAMNGGQCLSTLLQQPCAAGLIESAVNAPDDRLTADCLTDQIRIAQRRRGIVRCQDVGDRCSGGGRALLDVGLEFHAGVHIVGRAGAQDQRSTILPGHRVERPRGPTGPAGQDVQVLDGDVVAQYWAQHGLELFPHLRPNPKSR